jgi:hypothetical protein
MKLFWTALGAAFLFGISGASAQYYPNTNNTYGTGSNLNSHSVGGYTTHSGTYVAPHQQTNPNNTQLDNYGARGNYNPYTGQTGTRSPRW